MTRLNLAILALTLSSAACAQADDWSKLPFLPPLEYDHPYAGEIIINRVGPEVGVALSCPTAGFPAGRAIACNQRRLGPKERCEIFIASDSIIASVGLTYEIVLRHEIGHCNGWSGDHQGARYITEADIPAIRPIYRPMGERYEWRR